MVPLGMPLGVTISVTLLTPTPMITASAFTTPCLGVRKKSSRRSRRKVAGGDVAKNEAPTETTTQRCYEALLANPTAAVQAMDDTIASGLSRLVADYLGTKVQ